MGASGYGRFSRSREFSRYLALGAACALQLLFALAFLGLGRGHGSRLPPSAVTAQIVLLAPSVASTAASAATPAPRLTPLPLTVPPVTPRLSVPEIDFPSQEGSAPQPAHPPTDWTRAAHRVAGEVVGAQILAQRRRQATGEMPWPDAAQPGRAGPAIPWSHQPLTRWFDFDPATLVSSINLGKHCQLVFFVILPGFGCILGHIDSGGGGHFEASFDLRSLEPPPLELPGPGLPTPADLHPWTDASPRYATPTVNGSPAAATVPP
jgi:hypothetical protein